VTNSPQTTEPQHDPENTGRSTSMPTPPTTPVQTQSCGPKTTQPTYECPHNKGLHIKHLPKPTPTNRIYNPPQLPPNNRIHSSHQKAHLKLHYYRPRQQPPHSTTSNTCNADLRGPQPIQNIGTKTMRYNRETEARTQQPGRKSPDCLTFKFVLETIAEKLNLKIVDTQQTSHTKSQNPCQPLTANTYQNISPKRPKQRKQNHKYNLLTNAKPRSKLIPKKNPPYPTHNNHSGPAQYTPP